MSDYFIEKCPCGHTHCDRWMVHGPRTLMGMGTGIDGEDLAQQVADLLNGDIARRHDTRVTELIRACSQEVIRRRLAEARLGIARIALEQIRDPQEGWSQHSSANVAYQAIYDLLKLKPEDFGRP